MSAPVIYLCSWQRKRSICVAPSQTSKEEVLMSSIKARWAKLLTCLFCAMFLCGLAMAQSVTGTISGTVVDASGQVIAGAKVTLANEQTASARAAVTNQEGDFN